MGASFLIASTARADTSDEKDAAKNSPETTLHPRPGFKVELMAMEPLIESPVAFDWAPDGRLWVVEMRDYPLGMDNKGSPGGRIVSLEDTDNDGRYDRSTVFLDGLLFPTSVMSWRRGVLVTCAPDIFYAEDTDGDGRADKREVLFTGFGEANPQHRVNGLRWGLDNWVYCANGDFAPARERLAEEPPDPTATGFSPNQAEDLRRLALAGARVRSLALDQTYDIRNRDIRIRPDEGVLDPQSGQSQFGRDRDDWGNWFGCHHATPMWHYVLDDRYLRRNPHVASPSARVEAPRSVTFPIGEGRATGTRRNNEGSTWTSGSSVMVYRDTLFGEDFANNWFACEPVHNLVHREPLVPQGVTFTSHRAADEERSEFLASDDPMFTPVSLRTGPDGALWVADMHRMVLEHPHWLPAGWETSVDVREGHEQGRIYRVYPIDTEPREWPRLDLATSAELVELLCSANGWLRDKAQQMLTERLDRAVLKPLEAQVAEAETAQGRLHSLCTLAGLYLRPVVLERALADEYPGVRRYALRFSEPAARQTREVERALAGLVTDPEPSVRLQLACTLGYWRSPTSAVTLGSLMCSDANDPYIAAAALSSVSADNIELVVETVLATTQELQPGIMQALLQSAVGFDRPDALAALVERLVSPGKKGPGRDEFIVLVGWLDALDARGTPLAQLVRNADAPLRKDLERLSVVFEAARRTARDENADLAVRVAATPLLNRSLDNAKPDLAQLAELITPQVEEQLALAAVVTLGQVQNPPAIETLLAAWPGYTPKIRLHVLEVLASRGEGVQAILDSLANGRILPQDIALSFRQRLLEDPNEELREQAARIFTDVVDPNREKLVQAYQVEPRLNGDEANGKKLFTKNCGACHKLGTTDLAVGPDLSVVRNKAPEWFVSAVLDPNRAVDARYLNYVAITKDGKVHQGVLAEESGNSITLVNTTGERQVVLRNNLDELSSNGKSAMPEGLEKEITPEGLWDVYAYLKGSQTGQPGDGQGDGQ